MLVWNTRKEKKQPSEKYNSLSSAGGTRPYPYLEDVGVVVLALIEISWWTDYVM